VRVSRQKSLLPALASCPRCAASLDRDTNAALNILNMLWDNTALQDKLHRSPGGYPWGVVTKCRRQTSKNPYIVLEDSTGDIVAWKNIW